jgi:hypothetical protein
MTMTDEESVDIPAAQDVPDEWKDGRTEAFGESTAKAHRLRSWLAGPW